MSSADREKWNRRYREGAYTERTRPSAIVEDWIERIPIGRALDVACGAGRNALFLAARGFEVDAVDISSEALDRARTNAQQSHVRVNWLQHDLDEPLLVDNLYQLILIIRYVNLPLIHRLAASLMPGGYLVCEQHLVTEADVIGPTDPAYRVMRGDLSKTAKDLEVLFLEEGLLQDPDGRTAALARLVAQRV